MELSYFSHVLTMSEKLEEEPHEKAPDRPKWWENPELSVYEKVAIPPLLWCNSGTDQAEGLSGLPEELYR